MYCIINYIIYLIVGLSLGGRCNIEEVQSNYLNKVNNYIYIYITITYYLYIYNIYIYIYIYIYNKIIYIYENINLIK